MSAASGSRREPRESSANKVSQLLLDTYLTLL